MDEKFKLFAVGLLVVLAAAFLFYFFFHQPEISLNKGTKINGQTFLYILNNATEVYIVEDLRNVTNDQTRHNIQQCGIDFAGSTGLVGKNLTIYALDSMNCVSSKGTSSISDCISTINKGKSIYITSGSQTEFYSNLMLVGIDENYLSGFCGFNIN